MPGLSFLCDLKKDLRNDESAILEALECTIHDKRFKKCILLNEKSFYLGSTSYSEYPITSFENESFIIYLEGMIYNRQSKILKEELNALAQMISSSYVNNKDNVAHWLLSIDGDFIIYIINKKTHAIYILNDALGRLPVYIYQDKTQLLFSREMRFIVHFMNNVQFDRMAIAQYLLFGFSLGKRTLLENIRRLEPATLTRINLIKSEIEANRIYQFNYDNQIHSERTIDENTDKLVEIFNNACINRAFHKGDYRNILSLSGGLDTRSILASFIKNKIPFVGVTRLSYDKREIADVKIAEQLAKAFNIDFRIFQINPVKGKDYVKLLRIKSGLNSLGMSFIIPFFERVQDTFSSKLTYFTGDATYSIRPGLQPDRKLNNIDDLVYYIVSKHQKLSLSNVAALAKLSKHEIIEDLKTYFLSYPEGDLSRKFAHFMYDRTHQLIFEAEDRNRSFFWSVSPFLSLPFINYAMNCPSNQKKYYKLYREFLFKLSPEAAGIINKDWGVSITSKKMLFKFFSDSCRNQIPRAFKDTLKRYVAKDQYDQKANIMNCLFDQIDNCDEINSYLHEKSMKSMLHNFNKEQIDNLFTITSMIENITCNKSMLEKFNQSIFT